MKKNLLTTIHVLFVCLLLTQMDVSAQWTKTAGPPGMNVKVLYHAGDTLYAGTSSKGVFRSLNNGLSWSGANTGIENTSILSLFSDHLYLYAGTDNGVYSSSDKGNSWNPANTGIQRKFVMCLFKANGFIFAGTVATGLFKSKDHGATWTDANGGALGSSTIHTITLANHNLVVVADNNIFYSNDNGDSWNYPVTSPFILVGNPGFVTHDDSIVVSAGTSVYRSFDAGATWSHIIHINDSISITGLAESGDYIYAGTPSGMYKSKNFGKTWTLIPSIGLRIGSRFLNHFIRSGKKFLLAFDEVGVAYTSDTGATWNYSLKGFTPAASIDNALSVSANALLSGTHSDGIYQSLDNAATWSKTGTSNNADSLSNAIIFAVLRIDNNIILAATCGFGLYRSADNGVNWSHITKGLPHQGSTGFVCINSLANSAGNILAGTDHGLYYSKDNGLTWHFSNVTGDGINVAGVAANDSVACAVVNGTTGFNKFYRSTNKGVTWQNVFSVVDDFTTMASDGIDHFYAGSFATGYVSNNDGKTWGNFGAGITDGAVYAIAVKDNNVWVGNSKGIFFSNDNAASFTDAGTGLDPEPNRSVQGFAVSSSDIFAGTFMNGLWKRPLSDFGISTLSTKYSAVTDLKVSISPNPVINDGVLSYHISKTSPVIINLFDAQGRNMKTLINTKQDAGNYQLKFSSRDFHAGNYFAVAVIGNAHSVIKFTVTK